MFRDYSCFFREKFPESFVCYLLFYRDVYSIGWAKQVWNLLEHGVVVGQGIFYIYQMIFIGENRRNVLEVTKMMSYEKFNLYLNLYLNLKGQVVTNIFKLSGPSKKFVSGGKIFFYLLLKTCLHLLK